MKVKELKKMAKRLRSEAVDMLYRAQSGHPGSTLSAMDILVALYFGGILGKEDHFLLSNGHACPALYVVLAKAGYFPKEKLKNLRQLGAGAQGHPHRGSLPGIEISSGSLGQGLSVGIGLTYANELKNKPSKIFVMMSDGEQEEGSTWEAVMLAPKLKLTNLIAVIDKNQFQIDGATADIMPTLDPLADKYRAFNWEVLEVDGHDMKEILRILEEAKDVSGPVAIISHTIRGKGVSFMEGSEKWHAGVISDEQYKIARAELKVES